MMQSPIQWWELLNEGYMLDERLLRPKYVLVVLSLINFASKNIIGGEFYGH